MEPNTSVVGSFCSVPVLTEPKASRRPRTPAAAREREGPPPPPRAGEGGGAAAARAGEGGPEGASAVAAREREGPSGAAAARGRGRRRRCRHARGIGRECGAGAAGAWGSGARGSCVREEGGRRGVGQWGSQECGAFRVRALSRETKIFQRNKQIKQHGVKPSHVLTLNFNSKQIKYIRVWALDSFFECIFYSHRGGHILC